MVLRVDFRVLLKPYKQITITTYPYHWLEDFRASFLRPSGPQWRFLGYIMLRRPPERQFYVAKNRVATGRASVSARCCTNQKVTATDKEFDLQKLVPEKQ